MKLGDQELEVLRFIAEREPCTVREVVDGFGTPNSLARTTILTVVERLRKKGFLRREPGEAGFRYWTVQETGGVLQGLVRRFVNETLGGSISPLAAYLARADALSPDEIQELRDAVDALERRSRSDE